MDLKKKLKELKPQQLNCNVFDVYSYNGLTMQDLLCQFFTKINECITVSNETIDLAKWLVNEGLEIEVVKKLMLWLEDGTLENIINVNIFNTLIEYVDVQDRNLLRQISQGATDEQLERAVQSKIDDGTIASLSIGANAIRPSNLNEGARNYKPLVWLSDSSLITKNDISFTISDDNKVGVIYRNEYKYIPKGTYTFSKSDKYLVLRSDVVIECSRTEINESDIILAYKGGTIWTIWDSVVNEYKTNDLINEIENIKNDTKEGLYQQARPFMWDIKNINKTNNDITITGSTGCIFKKGSFFIENGTYELTDATDFLVARDVEIGKTYDGKSNPKIIPVEVNHGKVLPTDIILAIKYSNYIWTIWDSIINNNRIDTIKINNNNSNSFSRWKNKKLLTFGDSITNEDKWQPHVKEQLGLLEYINAGVGGTSFAITSDNVWNNNDNSFCNRVDGLDTTCDVVVVWGGTNDFGKGVPIGEKTDTTNLTFYGAVKNTFDKLIQRIPNSRICVLTAMQRKHRDDVGNGIVDGINKVGCTVDDYNKVLIEIAKEYSFPVLDMYSNSGITVKNIDNISGFVKFTRDGLHPTDEGYEKISYVISSFLNSI